MKETIHSALGHLNQVIEAFTLTRKTKFSMKDWLERNNISVSLKTEIAQKFAPLLDEVSRADKEPDLKEAYSYLKKDELPKLVALIQDIVGSASEKKPRKHREKKEKTKAEIVKGLFFLPEFLREGTETPIISVRPEDIVGCRILAFWNTAYDIYTVLEASDPVVGLQVRGSTVEAYSEAKSFSYRVGRYAEVLWSAYMDGNVKKAEHTKNILQGIRLGVPVPLTGRINRDCVLLATF